MWSKATLKISLIQQLVLVRELSLCDNTHAITVAIVLRP